MEKTIIVSGGTTDKILIEAVIKKMSLNNKINVIAVDKGLEALNQLAILPNHIIGDFDSIDKRMLDKYKNERIIIHQLEKEKDYTDTDVALRLAIELKSKEIVIIGASGTRLDHTIANVQNMQMALDNNINCKIIDNNNEITLINKTTKIFKGHGDKEYKYISLLPLTTTVTGITLTGFKYPLKNKTLRIGESIGISNEQVEDEAIIELKKGVLIIIKSRD